MSVDTKQTAHVIVHDALVVHAADPFGDLMLGADRAAVIAVSALFDAGRLLPAPTEVRVEYRAWLHGRDPGGIRLETDSSPHRAQVVDWAEEQVGRYGTTGYRVMRREHHIFPDGSRYATAITGWVEDTEEQR